MKKLLRYEHRWMAKRLEVHGIQYAGGFNEIYGHIVSAMVAPAIFYALSFLQVARKDYRQMMGQVPIN